MEISSHFIQRPDGTRIRAFDTGGIGPVVVLANGLGGPLAAFGPHIERLARSFRVVSWDYRGLYGSILGQGPADLRVCTHAEDVRAVLSELGIERAAFVGWSMGVQVGLELYRLAPRLVTHLVLLNGTFGRPLRGVPVPFAERVLPHLVLGARRLHFLGRPVLRGVRRTKLGPTLLKGVGFISSGFDPLHFDTMLAEFEDIDFDRYFALLAELSRHDAEHILPEVRCPTLVITGSRDIVTPSYAARRIARTIPYAELFVVQGGSHYAAAEYPHEILDRVEPFLRAEDRPGVEPAFSPGG